jgi:predicted DNA-binding transcriptional regulator AlpA
MNPEPLSREYLTCEDAARALSVSQRTLNRWGRMRKGPPRIKVGRSIYYRRVAIEDWLISLEAAGAATVATVR